MSVLPRASEQTTRIQAFTGTQECPGNQTPKRTMGSAGGFRR